MKRYMQISMFAILLSFPFYTFAENETGTPEVKKQRNEITKPQDVVPKKRKTKAKKEHHLYIKGVLFDYTDHRLKDSKHFREIFGVHKDYEKVVRSQMFSDYVNNLKKDEFEMVKAIIDEGTSEDVNNLISNFKAQIPYQDSHKSMMKKLLLLYSGPNRKELAMDTLQNWLAENGGRTMVSDLNIRKIGGNTCLVGYSTGSGMDQEKHLYKINLMADYVRSVWLEGE